MASCGDFNVLINNVAEKDGNTVIGFTEWTSGDRLEVRVEILGYRHQRETYTRDGQTLMFEVIDDLTDETLHSADKRTEFGDLVCNLATACIASKCWFGGLFNTLCGVCTSAVIACAIMDAFGWW